MIKNTIEFSIRYRWLMLLIAVGIVILGVISFHKLPIDAIPDVTNKQVQINTAVTGLSPIEIEKQITAPIEWAIQGVPGLEQIRSVSFYGVSQVTAIFSDETDLYRARQLISEKLVEAKEDIPPDVEMPFLGPIWTGLGEIYFWSIEAKGPKPDKSEYTSADLREIQDWIVKPRMRNVRGLTEINTIGGDEKQYVVKPDPVKLLAHEITFNDLLESLAKNNANAGGGYIEHSGEQYLIRSTGLVRDLNDIENIKVGMYHHVPVYVRDVAKVDLGSSLKTGDGTWNGNNAIIGTAILLAGENSRTVSQGVASKIAEINKNLPENVEIKTIYDRSYLVNATLETVRNNLLEGAIFVIVILFLMLGEFRIALIVAATIPLSMCLTLTGMVSNKISGNLMSLGAIDFGIIIDGAVVLAENIVRRYSEEMGTLGRSMNLKERLELTYSACAEVSKPVIFGVIIIMAVYLPILTLSGVEGKMFKPMALVVLIALASALVLTFTIIPAFVSIALGSKKKIKHDSYLNSFLKKYYLIGLKWTMANPWKVVLSGLGIFIVSLFLALNIGTEFVPKLQEGAIAVQPSRIPSIALSESVKLERELERELMKEFPDEIEGIFARTGTSEVVTDVCGPDLSDAYITLKPKENWNKAKSQQELVVEMEKVAQRIPGSNYEFSQPIELRMNELISGVRSDIAVKVYGEDLDKLTVYGNKIADIVKGINGAADVKLEQVAGQPVVTIDIDRNAIARYGLNVNDVQDTVEIALGGGKAGEIIDGDKRFDLVVRLPDSQRSDIEFIKSLPVAFPEVDFEGGVEEHKAELLPYVPLSELAKIEIKEGPRLVKREDGMRRIQVQLNVRGRDLGSFIKEAQQKVDEKLGKLDDGYFIQWGGQFENMISAEKTLSIVIPLSIGLILILLFAVFKSIKSSLLVFTGVPLALTGGIFSLWLRGYNFSISAAVGFIALSGVAVLNGIVIVSFINKLRADGLPLIEAIIQGATLRVRPVLMTAMVASFGFIPMAVATGMGAEVQSPLATVVIGGILSSTLLTLFVLPALYLITESLHGSARVYVRNAYQMLIKYLSNETSKRKIS